MAIEGNTLKHHGTSEAEGGSDTTLCALLRKALYGLRDAPRAFEMKVLTVMQLLEFSQGLVSPCTYYLEPRCLRVLVHGDDFIVSGKRNDSAWFRDELGKHLIVKDRGCLGPDNAKGDIQCVTILGRIVTWNPPGSPGGESIFYEADPRHGQLLAHQLGLRSGAKGAKTPGVKQNSIALDSAELDVAGVTKFRSCTMRASYLGLDRPEMQFACKESARRMSKPLLNDWEIVKRLGRFVVGSPRVVWIFARQNLVFVLDGYADADWAGDTRDRKSTTSSGYKIGKHCCKTHSSSQNVISLSSGEAEFYSSVKTASVGLGLVALAKDWGVTMTFRLWTDSSAAKGMASRRGVGGVRHIETQTLWLQRAVTTKQISVHKIDGARNPADLGTKHLPADRMWMLLGLYNIVRMEGSAALALKATV